MSKYNWPALIAAHAKSGLTQAAFCRREGIDPRYFSLQKTRRARDSHVVPSVKAKPFVQARPAASAVSTSAILELRVGTLLLRIPTGTDPRYVAALVAALPC